MRLKAIFFCIVSSYFFALTLGCGKESNLRTDAHEKKEKKEPARDSWQISGHITPPQFSNGEVLAFGMDGERHAAKIGADNDFMLELPGNKSYAVYFFPPSHLKQPDVVAASDFVDGAIGFDFSKDGWAALQFQDSPEFGMRETLRLPMPRKSFRLDFGNIDITGHQAMPANNPANELDYDSDGIADSADPDDHNDGRNDRDQKNVLERVLICHYTSNNSGTMESIPLSILFTHLSHGDTVGPCPSIKHPSKDSPDKPAPLVTPSVIVEESKDVPPQAFANGKKATPKTNEEEHETKDAPDAPQAIPFDGDHDNEDKEESDNKKEKKRKPKPRHKDGKKNRSKKDKKDSE